MWILEAEIKDELAPHYTRELFRKELVVRNGTRHFFFPDTSSTLTPGPKTVLYGCVRTAFNTLFGAFTIKAISGNPIYQEEEKDSRRTSHCGWMTISPELGVKVKVGLLLGLYEGTSIFNRVFKKPH